MTRTTVALLLALCFALASAWVRPLRPRAPHPLLFEQLPVVRGLRLGALRQRGARLQHTFEEAYFDQTLDHFNAEHGNTTFRQRYLFNRSFWAGPQQNAPIFLYTDAEGIGVDNTWEYSGWVLDLAQRFAALPIFVEHRFFGKSRPWNDTESVRPTADRIGLLSEEQVLADLTLAVQHVQQVFNCSTCPVVAFGGSLAGSIATYLRLKYPFVADMAIASSAPILGYEGMSDPYEYYRFVTQLYADTDPSCPQTVRQGFAAYEAATIDQINVAFNPCKPLSDANFWFMWGIAWGVLGWYPSVGYPPSQDPLPYACQRMANRTGLEIFAQLLEPYHVGQCFDTDQWNTSDISGTFWSYLSCTEIIHPVGTNNVSDMFPPGPWDPSVFTRECQDQWGVSPRYRWIPQSMGTYDLRRNVATTSSRIVFTNGGMDAWSTSGVLKNVSDTIRAIFIPEGGHVTDFATPVDDDTAGMIAARQQIADYVAEWLPRIQKEKAAAMVAVGL